MMITENPWEGCRWITRANTNLVVHLVPGTKTRGSRIPFFRLVFITIAVNEAPEGHREMIEWRVMVITSQGVLYVC